MHPEDLIFFTILAGCIGLIVQYFIIKAAVSSALKNQVKRRVEDDSQKILLEIIAKSVGSESEMDKYFKEKRRLEYLKKYKEIHFVHHPEPLKTEKINALKNEYADVLNEK